MGLGEPAEGSLQARLDRGQAECFLGTSEGISWAKVSGLMAAVGRELGVTRDGLSREPQGMEEARGHSQRAEDGPSVTLGSSMPPVSPAVLWNMGTGGETGGREGSPQALPELARTPPSPTPATDNMDAPVIHPALTFPMSPFLTPLQPLP